MKGRLSVPTSLEAIAVGHAGASVSEEPGAIIPCAVSRTERIATRGGRSSGQKTPRRTTNLDPKGRGNNSMLVKRRTVEDV